MVRFLFLRSVLLGAGGVLPNAVPGLQLALDATAPRRFSDDVEGEILTRDEDAGMSWLHGGSLLKWDDSFLSQRRSGGRAGLPLLALVTRDESPPRHSCPDAALEKVLRGSLNIGILGIRGGAHA